MRLSPLLSVSLVLTSVATAWAGTTATDRYLDDSRAQWEQLARRVWETPETSLTETRSSAALADTLEKEGFQVERGVAGMPTAWVATAGQGEPVVGILAEFDALPGLSQVAESDTRKPLVEGGAGQGCGHNLLGTAAVAAAVAANRERLARKLPGTIRVFGTPGEEQLQGKPFMARAGMFAGAGAILAWHPDHENRVINGARLAVTVVDVEFFGRSAHAAAAPWLGRSALDALMLFDHAIALMREHVLPTARMHRVVKEGGAVANVIPDHTRVQFMLRDASGDSVAELLTRFRKAADGAALATETQARVSVLGGTRDVTTSDTLARLLQGELERVGPPRFEPAEQESAKVMQKAMGVEPAGFATSVSPYTPGNGESASSDIGEVSAAAPLAELGVATRPHGTAPHTWVQTACSGRSIGYRGMLVAAKVLGASLVDLLKDPAKVKAARAELANATSGKPYVSPLPADAKPRTF